MLADFPYDLSIVIDNFHLFIPAAWMTMKITAAAILVGMVFGLIAAFMKISKYWPLRLVANIYITIIRGTPILLQLFIIYYGLAEVVALDAFPSAVIAFGAHNGAYIAEIFRGAIQSIEKGQMEAARSLGMTHFQAMRRVILPQAFKRAVPPLGNQFIIALKDSSLASTIAVRELLLQSRQMGASAFSYMEFLIIAGAYYLILTSIFSVIVNRIEKRLSVSDR
ncbi:polar amino acid transport system permease protein [Desulfitispora alkaliphila]|uniref:amino acid ABC transporter permease n=1 Tax=Desulfitispora alkaliphila TaxID=622674 RepID=UPI003D19BB33